MSMEWRIYGRSVVFMLITAVQELYHGAEVVVQFTANKGLFCELNHLPVPLDGEVVASIERRMRQIVAEDRPLVKKTLPRMEAVQFFKMNGQIEKANLIASLDRETVSVYSCGSYDDYLYGKLCPSTGGLGHF